MTLRGTVKSRQANVMKFRATAPQPTPLEYSLTRNWVLATDLI